MKFSHTLSLNANPDWAKHYIDYAGLKKIINESNSNAEEFLDRLRNNIDEIRGFFFKKRDELAADFERVQILVDSSRMPVKENTALLSKLRTSHSMNSLSGLSSIQIEDIRREICDLYTQYHNLKVYASLNW